MNRKPNTLPLAGRILVPRDRITADIDLTVTEGERIALIGANGSGKSTLLGALTGLAPIDRNSTITLFGTPLREVPLDQRHIGYLAQDGLLFPHLSAVDNVAFAHARAGHVDAEAGTLVHAQPG